MSESQPTQQQIDDWASIGRFVVAARALELKIAMRTAKADLHAHRFPIQFDIEALEKLRSLIVDVADEYLEKIVTDRKAELLAQAEQIGLVDEGFAEIKPQ